MQRFGYADRVDCSAYVDLEKRVPERRPLRLIPTHR